MSISVIFIMDAVMVDAEDEFQRRAKTLLKAELRRSGVSYRDLATKLTEAGSPIQENGVANRISRGGFSAAWFLQALSLAGCRTLHLDG